MENLLKIIRILEVIGFLIANFAVIILFSYYISNTSPILYILAFCAAILILKTQWFIRSKENQRNLSLFDSTIGFFKNISISWIKFFVITIKQMFYNVLFELFPVLVIWLCVFGFAYFIGSFFPPMSFFPFMVKDSQSFFGIVTLFGIILGVFQYYLQRHEDKMVTQISHYAQQIVTIINEETNFQNFYEEIPKYTTEHLGHEVQKWIERKIDQKYKLIDLLRELDEDKDRRHLFFDLVRNTQYESIITIKEDIPTSDMKFEMIELYAIGGVMHEKLNKVYRWYFDDTNRINEVYSKLTDQIDIDGFSKLVLTNINIIQEILPLFINEKFKNFFEKSLVVQDFSQFKPRSASEFRSLLALKIYTRIMSKILS